MSRLVLEIFYLWLCNGDKYLELRPSPPGLKPGALRLRMVEHPGAVEASIGDQYHSVELGVGQHVDDFDLAAVVQTVDLAFLDFGVHDYLPLSIANLPEETIQRVLAEQLHTELLVVAVVAAIN
jgi:hypothetical protein